MLNWLQKKNNSAAIRTPIALSMGEPAGIGAECLLKCWLLRKEKNLTPFFVVGDPDYYAEASKQLRLSVPLQAIQEPAEAVTVFDKALPITPLKLNRMVKPGEPDPANAAVVLESIKQAVQFVLAGKACALTTLPIHKSTLYQSGFQFGGHTEFLASLCQSTRPTVMMLEIPTLRVALSTVHISLKDALQKINANLIVSNALTVDKALKTQFGIATPRLAVAALNPHAGENGALGLEEIEFIQPAVEMLRTRGVQVTGPWPADTMFHKGARAEYDCAICLYHDQGLIPIKTLDFHGGVNITLGLPITRTSPDHGTAFDIAGMGKADATSLTAALQRAAQLSMPAQAVSAA